MLNSLGKDLMRQLKIGDLVEIIDPGSYYPNFSDWARKLKLTKWIEDALGVDWESGKGMKGIIVAIKIDDKQDIYAVDMGDYEILIHPRGVKLIVQSNPNSDIIVI